MKSLEYLKIPQVGACAWLAKAAASKKVSADVLARAGARLNKGPYMNYGNLIAATAAHPGRSAAPAIGQVLKAFYSDPPVELGKLLATRRRDHGLDECPYCGNPEPPTTLDHFIPKDEWPEFSILPDNLVPQCRSCAPIKGKRFACPETEQHLFLHPMYSDVISQVQFSISVASTGARPTFSVTFYVPDAVQEAQLPALQLHLDNLRIRTRIVIYCGREFDRWMRAARAHWFDVRAVFAARRTELPDATRLQNWKGAFFEAMSKCDAALDALQAACPPPINGTPPPAARMIALNF